MPEIRQMNREKQQLRKDIKEVLKTKTPAECSLASNEILSRLKRVIGDNPNLRIACFISQFNEVDTKVIIKHLFASGQVVHVPSWSKDGRMWMIPQSEDEYNALLSKELKYFYEHFGHHIPMPPNPSTSNRTPVDICITPGLLFSSALHSAEERKYERIGYGFGHYDRYFHDYHKQHSSLPFIIGIGHDEQIVSHPLNSDAHDIHMDCLVSPSCLFQ